MLIQKVLILANNDIGLYSFRLEIIERLLSEGIKVYLSLPNGKRVADFESKGCCFLETPVDRRGINPIKDILLFFRYLSILRIEKPDVVLTYTIKPNIYGGLAASLFRTPYICNITGLGTAVERTGVLQKITLSLYKIALRKVACIFFQNRENETFFAHRNIQVSKHRLIPGSGVNLRKYSLMDYPDDNGKIRFVYISRIMKEKGIEEYLAAAKFIKNKYPLTEFGILGFCEEAYEQTIQELNKYGVVNFYGLQSDIRPFLKQAHCTIHPTYYPEGMSNVVLESAASGRPVITTNRSGCKEAVADGKTGFLFMERKVDELISKIELFLSLDNNTRRQMGVLAHEKMKREFDRNIVVDAYMDELSKL